MHTIIKSSIPEYELAADYELEMQTREWLREFWSRSIVAWIALLLSVVSIAISICSFNIALH